VTTPGDKHSTSMDDVKQLGLFTAIASLGYVFWVVGAMEMVERLAYYGVRAVSGLYVTAPLSKGGLGASEISLGYTFMLWALVQSILPVFTGGLSDRFGYKLTIFCSTVVKILGYLTMAIFHTYWGFCVGAVVLAAGTAIFKPGIQGTLVKTTNRANSSMAWGIFYQTVNIGGFLGPLVAARMRSDFSERFSPAGGWTMVFVVCALIISANFVLLLCYREVGKEERQERARLRREGKLKQESLWLESLRELSKPRVFLYLAAFSGFWFMFNALFDVLPLHIRDWVDRGDIMETLFGGRTDNRFFIFIFGMNKDGTNINPEGMLNLNAGLIMITCFFFAYLSGLMRATTSMVVGTLMATAALFSIGYTTAGWAMVGVIMLFSIGEMLSSPKFSEYIGNFAPNDKKAMYLGFSQIPLAVGWTFEGLMGPWLYGVFASKDKFSRELLQDRLLSGDASVPTGARLAELAESSTLDGQAIQAMGTEGVSKFVNDIPQGEAFTWLVNMTGESQEALTGILYQTHNIPMLWNIMGCVGIVSAIGIYAYGVWVIKLSKQEGPSA
jgi:POT family proton-dependent oligopeptide transporter